MIKINYYGIESANSYDSNILKNELIIQKTDIDFLTKQLEPWQKYIKIIVIGIGGSSLSFLSFSRALKGNGKKIFFLHSQDPDLINNLKKEYSVIDTVIISLSGNGDSIAHIETLLQFRDYSIIVVTKNDNTPLAKIAQKEGWKNIYSQDLPDRFSAFTAMSFVPAILFGVTVEKLQKFAQEMYLQCSTKASPTSNPAWKLASSLHRLALIGKDELYLAFYSYYLETTIPLFQQLVHETLNKDGKGITAIAASSPENQFHTNQRFFGGNKNILGIFVTVQNVRDQLTSSSIPEKIKDISIGDQPLSIIDNISLAKSLEIEYQTNIIHAQEQKIPIITIELDKIDSEHLASLIVLWQKTMYYLALLMGIDPLPAPDITQNRKIELKLRQALK